MYKHYIERVIAEQMTKYSLSVEKLCVFVFIGVVCVVCYAIMHACTYVQL